MLVEDGKVVARGPAIQNPNANQIDHGGKLLIPSFIDNHCHILPMGLDLTSVNLSATQTVEEALDLLRDKIKSNGSTIPGGWLLAVHYDHNRYGRHITVAELDSVTKDTPALLRHSSGHAALANTAALRLGKITNETTDPIGGVFGRDESGNLTGVLLEHAMNPVYRVLPKPTPELMVQAILAAGESMAGFGIASASDMQTGRFDLKDELLAYRTAGERGCKVSTNLYIEWKRVFGPRATQDFKEILDGQDKTGIAGIKIFADGAIGASTAAIYGKYTNEQNQQDGYSGTLMYPPEKLESMILQASEAGYQVSVHSIGDYSTDLVLSCYEKTSNPQRHRIEHAMLLSDQQIDRIAKLGCFVTFQPEFMNRFRATYKAQLGPERASKIKRARSLLDAGVKLSFSSDRPIVSGNPWDGIEAATNRRDGFDPAENCTRQEAVQAYTVWATPANEQTTKATLTTGEPADFQLLDRPEL
jgi:predicted amidohydrolase YtcJ